MGQLGVERGEVFVRGEVVLGLGPGGDRVGDTIDQLPDARLALRRADVAAEVLAHDDVRGELAPEARDLDVALLEDDLARLVADAGRPDLPLDLVVRMNPGTGEAALEGEAADRAAAVVAAVEAHAEPAAVTSGGGRVADVVVADVVWPWVASGADARRRRAAAAGCPSSGTGFAGSSPSRAAAAGRVVVFWTGMVVPAELGDDDAAGWAPETTGVDVASCALWAEPERATGPGIPGPEITRGSRSGSPAASGMPSPADRTIDCSSRHRPKRRSITHACPDPGADPGLPVVVARGAVLHSSSRTFVAARRRGLRIDRAVSDGRLGRTIGVSGGPRAECVRSNVRSVDDTPPGWASSSPNHNM